MFAVQYEYITENKLIYINKILMCVNYRMKKMLKFGSLVSEFRRELIPHDILLRQ